MSSEAGPEEDGSHRRPDGVFFNPWFRSEQRAGGVIRWMWQRLTRPQPQQPDPSVFSRATPGFASPRGQPGDLSATWIGHSTVLLQIGGLNVLTDPVFSARASPVSFLGPRRWVEPGVALGDLPPLDLVLLSHNHYDHLDAASIRGAGPSLACRDLAGSAWPRAVGPVALGVVAVEECDWWDTREAAGARVICTPAAHFSARTPFDRNRTLWSGWAIAAGGFRVYFAGDTGWHPEFPRIAQRAGPFDLALLPIGAYDPRWFMRPVHMNPEEAVEACTALAAAAEVPVMLPVHWGTFRLTDEPMDEPPQRARKAWEAAGHPAGRLRVLRHGETLQL